MATSNKDKFLKICIKGKENKIAYCHLPMGYFDLYPTIKDFIPNEDVPKFGENKLRIYWIDEEGDEILIQDDESYEIFIEKSVKKKIFAEIKETSKVTFSPTTTEEPAQSQSQAQSNARSSNDVKMEHKNVECDACGESPIVGFRYKCIQCPNFDLCMKCEGQMLHKQHAMFRFPVPIDRFHLHRSFFKKMKKNCFMRADSETEDDSHNHGRHHRRHSNANGRQNFISNLYTMMHDLAEGTDIQTNEATATASASASASTPTTSNDTEMKNDNSNTTKSNDQPDADIKIDPNYAKVGIQILNNFSEMFSKMLDPLGINVEVDIDLKENKKKTANDEDNKNDTTEASANDNQKSSSEEKENEEKDESLKNAASKSTTNNANESEKTSENSSLSQENQMPGGQQEKKRDSINDEGNDWTLVDKNVEEKNVPTNGNGNNEEGAVGNNKNIEGTSENSSQSKPSDVNYSKLSQDLWHHIQREQTQNQKQPQQQQQPQRQQQQEQQQQQPPPEMRAQIVYHRKPHINNAVIAMIAMGFSNEGNWLTHLLESVDGDISQALDLMKPVQ